MAAGCPSCVLTLTEDYPELAQGDDRARLVADHTRDVQSLVMDLVEGHAPSWPPAGRTERVPPRLDATEHVPREKGTVP